MAVHERGLALAKVAQHQHGVFTRRQAIESGFSAGEVDGRVRRREWSSIDHGVYRVAGTPASWRQRVIAACLAGPAVASHRTAAVLWGLVDGPTDIVEVTALRHRRRKQPGVVWHESVRLEESDLGVLDGIQVTEPTRTLLDLGSVLTEDQLLLALDEALRRSLTSVDRIRRDLELWDRRRRGSGLVRRAIAERARQAVPESVLESEFDEIVRRYDLPRPSRQWQVKDAVGDIVARVDFAYPAARLAIEVDGLRFHSSPGDWRADLRRQNRVIALGYRVLRFSADDIRRRPQRVEQTIRAALQHQGASLDPPGDGEGRIKG